MKARILCLVQKVEFPEINWNWRSTLSASILRSFATEHILNVSLIRQCLKLETYLGTNFSMPICEAILKSPEAKSIPDPTRELVKKNINYILTRAHTHPSLNYAINVSLQGSWLKLWDTTLDYGTEGTRHALAILQALTTPLLATGSVLLIGAHTLWSKIQTHSLTTLWNTIGQMPSLSPQKFYRTSHRQSWTSSASQPTHSQNSVYTITLTSYIFV